MYTQSKTTTSGNPFATFQHNQTSDGPETTQQLFRLSIPVDQIDSTSQKSEERSPKMAPEQSQK